MLHVKKLLHGLVDEARWIILSNGARSGMNGLRRRECRLQGPDLRSLAYIIMRPRLLGCYIIASKEQNMAMHGAEEFDIRTMAEESRPQEVSV